MGRWVSEEGEVCEDALVGGVEEGCPELEFFGGVFVGGVREAERVGEFVGEEGVVGFPACAAEEGVGGD